MNDAGFEDFVRQSLPALGRYAYVLTGSRHQAEDLVQDTLVRVGSAWRRVNRDGSPLAYARTTMIRLHVSGWRWRRRRSRIPGATDPGRDDPALAGVEDRAQLRQALDALPPLQRAVIVLGYFDDLDDAAIAGLVRRKPATVRSLRHRALGTLRAALRDGDDAGPGVTERPPDRRAINH